MTEQLFLTDPYLSEAEATVTGLDEAGGIVLDRTVFYATGGGQPGDVGALSWQGGHCEIAATVKGENGAIIHRPAEGGAMPEIGTNVAQKLDWDLRFAHMKMHTALHLLSVVIALPVTGGAIGAEKSRLDFQMPQPPEDKQAIEDALNALIAKDYAVTQSAITEAELDANPGLVKTMSVQPPRGSGHIRLIQIGQGAEVVDLQPCGGTHVARTSEIGRIRVGKIENKGRDNRRVNIHFAS